MLTLIRHNKERATTWSGHIENYWKINGCTIGPDTPKSGDYFARNRCRFYQYENWEKLICYFLKVTFLTQASSGYSDNFS
nr:Biomphalaria glabrata polycystin-1-like; transcript variant X1 [Biomphalaria glabrata]